MAFQDRIAHLGRTLSVPSGGHVFRQGAQDARVYLLQDGFLKAYYVSEDGREHVKSLLAPGAFIGSMAALTGDGACTFSLIAGTPCTLRAIDYVDLRAASRDDHDLALALIDFLVLFARRKERREYELLCLSAPERRRIAMEQTEVFAGVFHQADIAAYIGVTPQAFSRMKKRDATG